MCNTRSREKTGSIPVFFFNDGAQGGTRTRTDRSTRPSNVRGYQLRHLSKLFKKLLIRRSRSVSRGGRSVSRGGRSICRRSVSCGSVRRRCGGVSVGCRCRCRSVRVCFDRRVSGVCRRCVGVARQDRDIAGQCGHRQEQGRDHEQDRRGDRHFGQNGRGAAGCERRTRNVARKQCSGIGLTRLQKHSGYKHDAREKKYEVENVFQLIEPPIYNSRSAKN